MPGMIFYVSRTNFSHFGLTANNLIDQTSKLPGR